MEADEEYIETLRCIVEQEKINQELSKEGLSNDLLDRQVELNTRRHNMNIIDREEIKYIDEDGEVYVQ